MSNDFEKAVLLAKLGKAFKVDGSILNEFLNQIESNKIKEDFSRIKRGLGFEEEYQNLFETLPWVKNLHGLEQKQNQSHKENYQVPDFSLLIENNEKENFPILVEVKSVRKNKENFEMIPKQKHALSNYARDNNKVIVLAIYWEKYEYWTHTVLTALKGKKKNKMTFEDAFKNDISHVISDHFFFIQRKIYRKIKFSEANNNTQGIVYKKYGTVLDIYISKDGKNYNKIDAVYSAVIDSAIPMEEIHFDKQSNTLIEVFDGSIFMKLSTWILRYLNLLHIKDATEIPNNIIQDGKGRPMSYFVVAQYAIIDLMHQLDITTSYLIPEFKDKHTDKLFDLAYCDSSVMKSYMREKLRQASVGWVETQHPSKP